MTQIKRHFNGDVPTTGFIVADARTSFMSVFQPRYNELKKADEFTVDVLIPKNTDMSEFNAVVKDVKEARWGNKVPSFRYEYLKDGDKKFNRDGELVEGYKGMVYLTAKSQADQPPRVVDLAKKPITEANEFQSGDQANFFIEAYSYDNAGNAGIAFQLVSIQKKETGERFAGGASQETAVNAFDAFNTDVSI